MGFYLNKKLFLFLKLITTFKIIMNIFSMLFSIVASWGAVTETPKYNSLGNFAPMVDGIGEVAFEVRNYEPSVAAETCNQGESAFNILAEYIYGSEMSSAPEPTDDRVELKSRPQMIMAAIVFNGWASSKDFEAELTKLNLALKAMETDDSFLWTMKTPAHVEDYQYNDPWTLGPFRTNEVVVELVQKN